MGVLYSYIYVICRIFIANYTIKLRMSVILLTSVSRVLHHGAIFSNVYYDIVRTSTERYRETRSQGCASAAG